MREASSVSAQQTQGSISTQGYLSGMSISASRKAPWLLLQADASLRTNQTSNSLCASQYLSIAMSFAASDWALVLFVASYSNGCYKNFPAAFIAPVSCKAGNSVSRALTSASPHDTRQSTRTWLVPGGSVLYSWRGPDLYTSRQRTQLACTIRC